MFEEYIEIIEKRLNPKRFVHSLNVAISAKELAKQFGADENKAYLCGLLHDICKNDSDEKLLQMFDEFDIILDNVQKNQKKLWHAVAGAVYVEKVLKINDADILNAIRFHTTARMNMSTLEKIVYLADFTSADRDFDGVDKLRESVSNGMDDAIFECLKFTMLDLCERNKPVHIDTVNAYNKAAMIRKD